MNPKHLMDTALLAGTMLIESNAETYRVEETMHHILSISHFETVEVYAVGTAVMATIDDESINSITEIKATKRSDINLSKITKVNQISRALSQGQIDLETAYQQLLVADTKEVPQYEKDIAVIIMIGGFGTLFSGRLRESIIAMIAGLWLPLITRINDTLKVGTFFLNVVSVVIMTLSTGLIQRYLYADFNMGLSIIGTIMPLVPGTAITNAIRDTLRGDYISGSARAIEAFIVALSIALGVALGLLLLGGGAG
ncbi:threonine/serine ThrE exporter family protein [Bavariicoccus seileri]|uniref:threonine/serine ThrE exporter family protein n=1 Tax=Bavariicoccus seileri TaxID=549685 RepID=UPI0003B6B6BA|nr:threonine/serine exporter family protein [Bavariicoccus seileri]